MRTVEIVLGLVGLATVVATLAERLRAPAPSLLVLAGLGVGLIPGVPEVQVGPSVVSLLVLPPLIYAGATEVVIRDLRRVAGRVAALAVVLVIVTAFAVAAAVHLLAPAVSLSVALVLGAVLASTDPVAVGALARRLRLPPNLLAVVQGESLLNDASSLVLFRIALAVVVTGGTSGTTVAGQFILLAAGGAAVGLIGAVVLGWFRRRTLDPVLTTVAALVTPYAVYIGAESVQASGVTAVVVAGLAVSRRDPRVGSAQSRVAVETVYAVVVFLLESMVFALIGLQFPTLLRQLPANEPAVLPLILAVTAVLLLVRALGVLPTALLPRRGPDEGSTWRLAAVATWAGTRGVVPLAATLSIPIVTAHGAWPHRDLLLVVSTGVIVFTLVAQGLTLEPLVRRLGVSDDPARLAREEVIGRNAAAMAAQSRLEHLLAAEPVPEAVAKRLRRAVNDRVARTQVQLDVPSTVPTDQRVSTGEIYRRLRRDLLTAESQELLRLRDQQVIGEVVRRKLQAALDAEATGLG